MGPDAFDYTLPPDRIAHRPAARRGEARMLVVGPPMLDAVASELPARLPADALVVNNRSAVVPARLVCTRSDGRSFELLMCSPAPDQSVGATVSAWVRGAKKLRAGDKVSAGALTLQYVGPDPIDPRARVFCVVAGAVLDTLASHGQVPLPPYIERPGGPDADDHARYQTVYAGPRGSVAAPTAGLHWTEETLNALDVVSLVLHVGPGTFLPMDEDADITAHRVGAERVELGAQTVAAIQAAQAQARPIVAIGTTVVRALEGVLAQHGALVAEPTQTDLVVTPGFRFGVVTHLVTNFHLPRSSLLMLTCAFGGRQRVLSAYAHAVQQRYRFYSYGDCMLLSRGQGAS